jgi:hypothetical protein
MWVVVTWATLIGTATAAVYLGRADVAVALGGAKAALVGLTFLELRHAAWAHAVAWLLLVGATTAALVAAVR